MDTYIAVDIGGTQLRAAIYPVEGLKSLEVKRIPTRSKQESPLERLIGLLNGIWPDEHTVQAIGVAVPGPTDPYQGLVIEAANIPGWNKLPLEKILKDRFQVPVILGNDANMAALGEWRYGAAQGHHNILYLTVSTGIGSGIIVNDKLLLGARGLAGELGHVTILMNGPICSCGQPGHLEALASGTALMNWVKDQLARGASSSINKDEPLIGKMITEAAKAGDELAIQAFERSGTYMGIALASHLHIFNPTAVVIGGGVSESGDFLLNPLKRALESHVMAPQYLENLKISRAVFGDDAGLVGALTLARDQHPLSKE